MQSLNSIIRYDVRNLEETIKLELVELLKLYNEPDAADVQVLFKIDTESTQAEKKLAAVESAWNKGAKVKASDVMDMIGLSMPQPDDKVLFNPQVVPPEGAVAEAGDGQPLQSSTDADLHGALSHALAHANDPKPSSDADLAATVALATANFGEKAGIPTEAELRSKFGPLMDVAA